MFTFALMKYKKIIKYLINFTKNVGHFIKNTLHALEIQF